MNTSCTTLEWVNFNSTALLATSPTVARINTLVPGTADFLLRVATKRQYVRAIQAMRRR